MPSDNGAFRPPVSEQRAMIEHARDSMRRRGYQAELELSVLAVQGGGDRVQIIADNGQPQVVDLQKRRKDLELGAANAYAAARELQRQLDQLPKDDAESDS